ncbi:MAG TPA: hypothetical protein VGN17_21725 [Bryobacteraceae bacterium]
MRIRKLPLAALLVSLTLSAASPIIQLDRGLFKVTGLDSTGPLPDVIVVIDGQDTSLFGSSAFENGTLVFRPRFPLTAGLTYRVTVIPARGEKTTAILKTAAVAITDPPTRVAAVYPTSPTIPSNELKLYVTFSEPMQRGDVWPKIHLIDETGKPATLPFIELPQELWDRDLQRLTLLFDPGRIKRGVGINESMGPVLTEGRRYTLVIDADLPDGHGRPLAETFRRTFTVGPAERRGIDLKLWKITEPAKNTSDPLIIKFDRPLDYALLQHVFTVPNVPGTSSVTQGETEWRFQPAQPWKSGDYNLVIDMTLEDLAGNRIGRPFDVDTLDNPTERISKATTSLLFHIR